MGRPIFLASFFMWTIRLQFEAVDGKVWSREMEIFDIKMAIVKTWWRMGLEEDCLTLLVGENSNGRLVGI